MTIVEIERVSAPPKEREDAREERERRASVLEAAALEIEVRGWGSVLVNAAGNVCANGGLAAVLGVEFDGRHNCDLAVETSRLAVKVWGDDYSYCNLSAFNDYHAESADEVTFLLRWRASEIRDGR